MSSLLDINVVLDVLLVRQPWYAEAAQVWDANRDGQISAAEASFTLPTVFYIMRRQTSLPKAHDAVRICLTSLEIVPVNRSTLELARSLAGSDFEDNLQVACAIEGKCDSIVTRNPTDFSGASMPVLTAGEFISRFVRQRS